MRGARLWGKRRGEGEGEGSHPGAEEVSRRPQQGEGERKRPRREGRGLSLPAGRRPRGWLRPELPKLPWRKGKARQPGKGPRDLKSGHAPPTEGEGLHLSPGLPAPPWQPLLLVNQVKKIRCSQTSGFPTFLSPPSVFHKKHELLQKLLKSRKPHLCALRKALLSFPVSSLPEPYPQLLRAPAAAAFSPRPPPACCASWLFVTRGCSISLWSRKV